MCKPWYLYGELCDISQQYVALTENKFSTRWSAHPGTWNKPDNRDDSDQIALFSVL